MQGSRFWTGYVEVFVWNESESCSFLIGMRFWTGVL
jgi:hypothetical protein